MSEHERGDRVLLRARVDGSGPSGSVVIVADRGTVHHVDPADLIPDDRHRTPIAPDDVREGDVVRLEHDGTPRVVEGLVMQSILYRGRLFVAAVKGGVYVDSPDCTLYLIHRAPTERDKWWPPQVGDVAEWGGHRWWFYGGEGEMFLWWNEFGGLADHDVPDDAVLVLPAQTREATS
mgnify:CR=1 FL=1